MNLEIEANVDVEIIEVFKIALSDNKSSNSKSIYFALNNDQLIRLSEEREYDVKGVGTIVIKESINKPVELNNVKNVTIPIKVNLDKEKMEELFIKFVDKHHKKENTTTENSDVQITATIKNDSVNCEDWLI